MTSAIALRLAVTLVVTALTFLGGFPTLGHAALFINEIMADPASDWDGDGAYQYRDDEWVEIINTGPEAVDLAGHGLRDAASTTPRLLLEGTLAPGQVLVLYGSDAVAWQQSSGATVAGFSLNNGGDVLELALFADQQVTVLDTVTYQDHEADDDRSCGRNADTGEWQLFDALNPHAGTQEPLGTGCAPSPGAGNICAPEVANEDLSLDSLKSRFR